MLGGTKIYLGPGDGQVVIDASFINIMGGGDIYLPAGGLRIRKKGSDGGHNGLKNIIYLTGRDDFPRARIGVGEKPNPQYDLAAWVLGKLPAEDRKAVTDRYPDIEQACKLLMDDNLQYAQNKFNR